MGKGRAPCCDKEQVKRGPWSPAEDMRLTTFIQKHGHENWRALPKQAGLLRCGKSCRLRWINYLRPDVKRGNFTPQEEHTIISLHQSFGNKWSKIASHLPGRTDNEIKNVWNTHLKKRLQKDNNENSSYDDMKGNPPMKDGATPEASSFSSSPSDSSMSFELQNSGHEALPVCQKERPKDDVLFAQSDDSIVVRYNGEATRKSKDPSSDVANATEREVEEAQNEIPLESDVDFWDMLDNLGYGTSNSGEAQSGEVQRLNECKIDVRFSEEEEDYKRKWLRHIENELGLASDADQQPMSNCFLPQHWPFPSAPSFAI